MAFSVPSFPLQVAIYTSAGFGAPARVTTTGNLAWGRRVSPATGGTSSPGVIVGTTVLLPIGTDVRDGFNATGQDGLIVPAGSGRKYLAVLVDDVGKGFPNEHRAVLLVKTGVWPTPVP